MLVEPNSNSGNVGDLGRAGQERLEGTIAPPQVGDVFHVDPVALTGIYPSASLSERRQVDHATSFPSSWHHTYHC